MPDNSDPDDYQVGYKKPPKDTQFRKGHSGNPKGRPKGSVNLKTALNDVLNEKIKVTERGQPREITIGEGIITRLAAKALNGDVRSAQLLIDRWINLSPEVLEPQEAPQLELILRREPQ